jgi:hypothetical protein
MIAQSVVFDISATLTVFEIYQGGRDFDNDTSSLVGCDDGAMHVQCRDGHPRCYVRSSTCIYDTLTVDDGADLEIQATCRDGAHLRNSCGKRCVCYVISYVLHHIGQSNHATGHVIRPVARNINSPRRTV